MECWYLPIRMIRYQANKKLAIKLIFSMRWQRKYFRHNCIKVDNWSLYKHNHSSVLLQKWYLQVVQILWIALCKNSVLLFAVYVEIFSLLSQIMIIMNNENTPFSLFRKCMICILISVLLLVYFIIVD